MRPNRASVHASTLALALLLVVAPVAMAEGDAQAYDYRFTWDDYAFSAANADGETAEGESTDVTVTVDHANVTAMRFRVTWDDDVGEPDTLRLTVFDPDGNERASVEDTQANGTLEAVVRVQETPPGTVTLRAPADADAWGMFHADYPPTYAGTGEWRAEVTVVEAGDRDGGLVGGIGGESDPGEDWTLTADGGAYSGILVEKTPAESEKPDPAPDEMPPPDDNTSTPPPDAGAEPPRDTSILSSRGAQSLLVVAAAAIGITAALLVARRGSAS